MPVKKVVFDLDRFHIILKQEHVKAGKTYQELQALTGINGSQIMKLVTGITNKPTFEQMALLCKYVFDYSLDKLATECGIPMSGYQVVSSNQLPSELKYLVSVYQANPEDPRVNLAIKAAYAMVFKGDIDPIIR